MLSASGACACRQSRFAASYEGGVQTTFSPTWVAVRWSGAPASACADFPTGCTAEAFLDYTRLFLDYGRIAPLDCIIPHVIPHLVPPSSLPRPSLVPPSSRPSSLSHDPHGLVQPCSYQVILSARRLLLRLRFHHGSGHSHGWHYLFERYAPGSGLTEVTSFDKSQSQVSQLQLPRYITGYRLKRQLSSHCLRCPSHHRPLKKSSGLPQYCGGREQRGKPQFAFA